VNSKEIQSMFVLMFSQITLFLQIFLNRSESLEGATYEDSELNFIQTS